MITEKHTVNHASHWLTPGGQQRGDEGGTRGFTNSRLGTYLADTSGSAYAYMTCCAIYLNSSVTSVELTASDRSKAFETSASRGHF